MSLKIARYKVLQNAFSDRIALFPIGIDSSSSFSDLQDFFDNLRKALKIMFSTFFNKERIPLSYYQEAPIIHQLSLVLKHFKVGFKELSNSQRAPLFVGESSES